MGYNIDTVKNTTKEIKTMFENWVKKIENENMIVYECNGWYIREECNRKHEVFFYVGNDDTEFRKAYRSFLSAMDFAEKHF